MLPRLSFAASFMHLKLRKGKEDTGREETTLEWDCTIVKIVCCLGVGLVRIGLQSN